MVDRVSGQSGTEEFGARGACPPLKPRAYLEGVIKEKHLAFSAGLDTIEEQDSPHLSA
jgi:hypothetical protein